MNLTILGHKGFLLTEALENSIKKAFGAVYEEFGSITSVRVILTKVAGAKSPEKKFTASVIVAASKKQVIVKKMTSSDMYAAIKRIADMVRNDFLARKVKWKLRKSNARLGLTEVSHMLNRRVALDRRMSFA